ncbi:DUF932 domain-containing protein [Candidatus Neomarinimicrobiota bacterium]
MDVAAFMFPVEERSINIEELSSQRILGSHHQPDPGHKVIFRPDTGELISVARNTYRLISNEELITQFYEELSDRQIQAFIDPANSCFDSRRMRLQITFPQIKFKDGDSEISLSLFVHNSYDGSESVRFVFGAMRYICENGMVLSESLTEYTFRHQRGVNIQRKVSEAISNVIDEWPIIEDKVGLLAMTPFSEDIYQSVEKFMGKTWSIYLRSNEPETMWQALNILTGYISHHYLKEHRAKVQQGVSKVFDL